MYKTNTMILILLLFDIGMFLLFTIWFDRKFYQITPTKMIIRQSFLLDVLPNLSYAAE
jgi:hypothetical protein